MVGTAGCAGAGSLGWHRYHSLAGTEVAQGILMEWVEERSTDASNRVSISHAPLVRFTARDGNAYRTKGLARDTNDLEPGSAVRGVTASTTRTRLIADFQNQWGGVWGLGLFGAIPAMMGAFFLAMGSGDGAHVCDDIRRLRRTPLRDDSARRRLARAGYIAAFRHGLRLGRLRRIDARRTQLRCGRGVT